jgi:hypothetical protein
MIGKNTAKSSVLKYLNGGLKTAAMDDMALQAIFK